ncbi:MAG: hypothetical protein RLZZ366_685 [Pseudomonadota bacterium]|jgi:DNA-binding transcriptional LysR family regulator
MVFSHLILATDEKTAAMQISERGVQLKILPLSNAKFDLVRLDDLNVFKVVAASRSLREAATKLCISVNTVRNKVDRLEATLGSTLFVRSREGIAMTAAGVKILEFSLEMQSLRSQLPTGEGNNNLGTAGEVRIGCSAGLGEFWLTPRLMQLQELLPELTVSLRNDFDQNRIHGSNNDLCVSFSRPTDNNAIVSKLATLHFMLYASDEYLRKFGYPTSINEAQSHKLVVHEAAGLSAEAIELFIGKEASSRLPIVKVNTSYSLYWAVANGGGIGALPTYACAVSHRVKPLDLPVQLKFDLWLSYDPSLRLSQPIRKTINWLRESFDPKKYPWFSDEFIHPDDFKGKYNEADVIPFSRFFD